VVDATILVPTFRHARLLPISLASALDQEDAEIEVLVVGDGVEDATRDVVAHHAGDPRVHFFDFPKGPRNGEAYRHDVLMEAQGRIVTYLCDDDLLLRDHVATMLALLEDADFAQPPATRFVGDELQFFPWNYEREEFREVGRVRIGSMGLTGVSHTLAAYHRLPHGWRTTPAGMPTDHHMWLQWLDVPGMRFVASPTLTHLNFPDPWWKDLPEADRASVLSRWLDRSRQVGFRAEADDLLRSAVHRAAEDYHLWAWREQQALATVRATRTWRLRERLITFVPRRR
jgi:glycosyltransferase involved in cell wall biosynthesis